MKAQRFLSSIISIAVFGFYLTPHAVGNAELTIGGIDHDKLQSPLVYVPVEPPDTFAALNFSLWVVNTTGISVNGKTSHTLNQTLSLIVDTGTSNMVFPEQIAKVSSNTAFPAEISIK